MASFLLDEHWSPRIARMARMAGVDVIAVAGGDLEGQDDESHLRHAIRQGRLLVTYDIADFSVLYADLLKEGVDVPGIVFVDGKTFPTSSPVAALARALAALKRRIDAGQVDPAGGIFLTGG